MSGQNFKGTDVIQVFQFFNNFNLRILRYSLKSIFPNFNIKTRFKKTYEKNVIFKRKGIYIYRISLGGVYLVENH